MMRRAIGMLILGVGVALSGAYGARLAPDVRDQVLGEVHADSDLTRPPSGTTKPHIVSPRRRLTSWFRLAGLPFSVGLLLIVAGGLLVRTRKRGRSDLGREKGAPVDEAAWLTRWEDARGALGRLLSADPPPGDPTGADYQSLKEAIAALQRDHIQVLAESRQPIEQRYGAAALADIIGPLASAERRLNRAWSALVDRHWPEAQRSLRLAAEDLVVSEQNLKQLTPRTG